MFHSTSSGIAAPSCCFFRRWKISNSGFGFVVRPDVRRSVEELEMGGGESRVEFRGVREIAIDRIGNSARHAIERAEIVVRDGIIGYKFDHLLELLQWLCPLRRLFYKRCRD